MVEKGGRMRVESETSKCKCQVQDKIVVQVLSARPARCGTSDVSGYRISRVLSTGV